eukprot:758717-Hanusia_phi.AAC.1
MELLQLVEGMICLRVPEKTILDMESQNPHPSFPYSSTTTTTFSSSSSSSSPHLTRFFRSSLLRCIHNIAQPCSQRHAPTAGLPHPPDRSHRCPRSMSCLGPAGRGRSAAWEADAVFRPPAPHP